jgi:hypothetical protein
MKQKYRYGTGKYISPAESLSFRFKLLVIFGFLFLAGSGAFLYDMLTNDSKPQTPTSPVVVKNVSFDNNYFSSSFFRFTDSGNWSLIKNQSTNNKIVFQKYLTNSNLVQHQLIVYINSTPLSLDLASSRLLPVTINEASNGFTAGQVSDTCAKTYGPSELHKIQLKQISGATLLCDPDQGQFRAVLSRIGGDYNLKLKRSDGSVANYIIIYQNQKLDPDTDTLNQIASSFQAL